MINNMENNIKILGKLIAIVLIWYGIWSLMDDLAIKLALENENLNIFHAISFLVGLSLYYFINKKFSLSGAI
jgi:hypothetical protein